jgi:hypothetical protein
MSWGTEYDTACNAYAPSRAQLAFDAHAKAVVDLIVEMRILTQLGPNWPNKGDDRISKLVELATDLKRELSVLSIEGGRP